MCRAGISHVRFSAFISQVELYVHLAKKKRTRAIPNANANAASKKISKNISRIANSSSSMRSVYYYAPSLSDITQLAWFNAFHEKAGECQVCFFFFSLSCKD